RSRLSHIVCFFSVMMRPPPRPTLFPYTTLFRSERRRRVGCRRSRVRRPVAEAARAHGGDAGRSSAAPRRARRRRAGGRAGVVREDRKSTRLNSSHDQISYAVFCLKKKKKQKGNI